MFNNIIVLNKTVNDDYFFIDFFLLIRVSGYR